MSVSARSMPTMAEWRQAVPGLRKRSAGRWAGPCPHCGGEDRFHVQELANGRVLWGCRGCLDGAGDRWGATRRILQCAFPERNRAVERVQAAALPRKRREKQGWTDVGTRVWAAARTADGSPAEAYLVSRLGVCRV